MFNIFKKKPIRAETHSKTNLVGKTFIMKGEHGNPFVSTYVIILAASNGWLQYNYVHKLTGLSSLSPMSMKIKAFFDLYEEVEKPF